MNGTYGQGRYRVIAPLGSGAFAEVLEVEDTRLGVRRALKVLRAELTADPVARARFAAEAQVMARLSHPHLVAVTDVGEDRADDGSAHVWLVMELLPGGTLAERVARRGAILPEEAVRAMLGVIDGVALAHRSGVIHRDIKPANLLFDAEGRLKLGDFGIAQLRSLDDLTRTGVALGSWAFMAPEQRLDPRGVGPASDVYGLAATLVWMIHGGPVSDLHVSEHRARLLVGVPDRIAGALSRALAFRAEERFYRVDAFGEMLAIGIDGTEAYEVLGRGGAAPPQRPPAVGEPLTGAAPRRVAAMRASAQAVLPGVQGWLVVGFAGVAGVSIVAAALGTRTDTVPAMPEPAIAEALPWCDDAARGFATVNAVGPRETMAVAVADVDRDGFMDALYTNQLDANVTIWWGTGTRQMGARQEIETGRSAYPTQVGDIDNDGVPDLVISLPDDSAFAVVRGLGERTFADPRRVMQGPAPKAAYLAKDAGETWMHFVAGGELSKRAVVSIAEWDSYQRIAGLDEDEARGVFVRAGDGLRLASLVDGRSVVQLRRSGDPVPERIRLPHGLRPQSLHSGAARSGVGERLLLKLADEGFAWLRLDGSDTLCRLTPAGVPGAVVNYLDGDDVIDMIWSDTCAGCTSEHVVRFGVRQGDTPRSGTLSN